MVEMHHSSFFFFVLTKAGQNEKLELGRFSVKVDPTQNSKQN